MIQVMLTGVLAILVYMSIQWVASLLLRNASIVDIFWGPGFALAAWVYYFSTPDGFSTRKLLIVLLVRFRVRNEFWRADGKIAARLTSTGGWLDLNARKLVLPPDGLRAAMVSLAAAADFELIFLFFFPNINV